MSELNTDFVMSCLLYTVSVVREMLQFEAQCGTGCLKNFNEALNIIRRRHLDTVPLMARAVMKLGDLSPGVNFTIQYFLNRYPTLRSTQRY